MWVIKLSMTINSVLQGGSPLVTLREKAAILGRPVWQKTESDFSAQHPARNEAFGSTAHKKLSATNKHGGLDLNTFPVETQIKLQPQLTLSLETYKTMNTLDP